LLDSLWPQGVLRTADRPYSIERQVVVSKQKKAGNGPIKKGFIGKYCRLHPPSYDVRNVASRLEGSVTHEHGLKPNNNMPNGCYSVT